ncbi:hypothetical protein F7725_021243, partial [Dissostichus mawsoni]
MLLYWCVVFTALVEASLLQRKQQQFSLDEAEIQPVGSGHSVRLELDNIMKESSFKGRTCFTIFLLLLTAFLIFFQ